MPLGPAEHPDGSLCCALEHEEFDEAHIPGALSTSAYDTGFATRTVVLRPDTTYATYYFDETAQPLDMILAEVRIPDGNGLQLLQAIRCGQAKCMRPNSTFVLTTAAPAIQKAKPVARAGRR